MSVGFSVTWSGESITAQLHAHAVHTQHLRDVVDAHLGVL